MEGLANRLQPKILAGVLLAVMRTKHVQKEKIMTHSLKHTHWLLWPVVALWKLLTGILLVTGRLVAVVLGGVFMLVGLLISLTVIGAVIGVPLFLLGLLLALRGIF